LCKQGFGGKAEGKSPLEKSIRRSQNNFKVYVHEVGWKAWTELTWLKIGTGGGHL